MNGLFRREEGARERPISLTTNTRTPGPVITHLSRRTQRISQGHLFQTTIDRTDMTDFMGVSDPESVSSQIEACASGIIEAVHPDLRPIPVKHYLSLLLVFAAGVVLATLAWVRE